MTALSYDITRTAGPAVVFIGSLGSDRSMWEAQRRAFGEKYRCVIVDLRGHGNSPVPDGPYSMPDLARDIVDVLDAENIECAHIVGLSLGGAIAQQVALDYPERVLSLTLASTSARFGDHDSWCEKAKLVRSKGTAAVASDSAHRWFTKPFGELGAFDEYTAMVSRCPDEGYAASCEALADFDSRERLAAVTAPTLAIAGAEDPSTTPAVVGDVADRIPGARIEVVPSAAHLVNVEQAETFNSLLTEHIAAAESAE